MLHIFTSVAGSEDMVISSAAARRGLSDRNARGAGADATETEEFAD